MKTAVVGGALHEARKMNMDSKPRSLNQVNKMLKANKLGKYTLVKGRGYFYLHGPDTESFFSNNIGVYSVSHLTLQRWLDNVRELINTMGDHPDLDKHKRRV